MSLDLIGFNDILIVQLHSSGVVDRAKQTGKTQNDRTNISNRLSTNKNWTDVINRDLAQADVHLMTDVLQIPFMD